MSASMVGVLLAVVLAACSGPAPAQDAATLERIDAFVAREVAASGLPGVAVAVIQRGHAAHVRGFGHDGRGNPVNGDTPFPIGSLSKSFTAVLVRQAIDAGRLDADAPVQRYLPWFRVADTESSARITLRHLLNQTSGFSRADGIAPLLQGSTASIDELARGLGTLVLNRPVGERFEYSNLNYVLLGAVLQTVMGQSWQALVQNQVLRPLAMTRSHVDHDLARQAGMTALHRMWFGLPVEQRVTLLPGYAPTGSLVSSAADMARYLEMLLAGGMGPAGRVLTPEGVATLLAPASPPARSTLLSADLAFRYGEGWFVGPFGAAGDARWHLGNLASFAAWMVLLPDTRQAVLLLINANSELPFNHANAVISRLPVGVVNLLRGQPPPQGPSLREAYLPFNAACVLALLVLAALAAWTVRARGIAGSVLLLLAAVAIVVALEATGLNARMLSAFAPDFAVVIAAALVLLCVPVAWRAWAWTRRRITRQRIALPA